VCGPAYALLLHTWGEPFLEQGEIELRFVGMVLGGDTVEAIVATTHNQAQLQVWNVTRDRLAAFGRASLIH
jgi:acyl dehydratase